MSNESMWANQTPSMRPAFNNSNNNRGGSSSSSSSYNNFNGRNGAGRGRGGNRGGSNNNNNHNGSGNGFRPPQQAQFKREVAPHLATSQGGHGPSSRPVQLPNNIPEPSHAAGGKTANWRAKEKEALWKSIWGDEKEEEEVVKREMAKIEAKDKGEGKTLLERMGPKVEEEDLGTAAVSTSTSTSTPRQTSQPIREAAHDQAASAFDHFHGRGDSTASRWAPRGAVSGVVTNTGRGGAALREQHKKEIESSSITGKEKERERGRLTTARTVPTGKGPASSKQSQPKPVKVAPPIKMVSSGGIFDSIPIPEESSPTAPSPDTASTPPELKTIVSGKSATFPPPTEPKAIPPPITPPRATTPVDRPLPSASTTTPGGTTTNWADEDDDEEADLARELEEMKMQWGIGNESAGGNGDVEKAENAETSSAPPVDTPERGRTPEPELTKAVEGKKEVVRAKPSGNLAAKAIGGLLTKEKKAASTPSPEPTKETPPANHPIELVQTAPSPTSPPPTKLAPQPAPLVRLPAKERPKANIQNDAFLRMSGGMFAGGVGRGGRRGRGGVAAGSAREVAVEKTEV